MLNLTDNDARATTNETHDINKTRWTQTHIYTHTPTNKKTKKTKQHRKNVLAKHRIGIGGAAHSNPTKKKAIKIEVGECDKVSIHMHITHILPREY